MHMQRSATEVEPPEFEGGRPIELRVLDGAAAADMKVVPAAGGQNGQPAGGNVPPPVRSVSLPVSEMEMVLAARQRAKGDKPYPGPRRMMWDALDPKPLSVDTPNSNLRRYATTIDIQNTELLVQNRDEADMLHKKKSSRNIITENRMVVPQAAREEMKLRMSSTLNVLKEDEFEPKHFGALPVADALARLHTNPKDGLTEEQVNRRRQHYGWNKLEEKKQSALLLFLSFMWNPLSWMMECAAIIAIVVLDYADVLLIVALLILNACIGFFEERSAASAVDALRGKLAPECRVRRDSKWVTVKSEELVPGDVVFVRLGDIVPADCKIIFGGQMKIDQSALTGESLAVTKSLGDVLLSGSIIKGGENECLVFGTGVNSFFGKAAALIEQTEVHSRLQSVLTTVGLFCMGFIIVMVVIELIVQFAVRQSTCSLLDGCESLGNILVLIIGGIPIAMPTVLSVTLAVGAVTLANKEAVVTRLTAIEELASMDVLCSDKTGTLTQNKLTVDFQSLVYVGEDVGQDELLRVGALSANMDNEDVIDLTVYESYADRDMLKEEFELLDYIPFDPESKRTIAKWRNRKSGLLLYAAKGAPQIVAKMDHEADQLLPTIMEQVDILAGRGFRALGVAISHDQNPDPHTVSWRMLGLIPLFDPPRHDSAETIRLANENGIAVKMITGDQLAIAVETARRLGMPPNIQVPIEETLLNGELVDSTDGFAEVYPQHKYRIVQTLQESCRHVVGMTGDGVNDAPALRRADIGIAVADATDAARAAADIVLLSPGLGVIIDAILTSRMIFSRMRAYCVYSIATTIRIVLTFGLATVIFDWTYPPIAIVLLAILNDGTILTISKDRVKVRHTPQSWHLGRLFTISTVYGIYLSIMSLILIVICFRSSYFPDHLNVFSMQQMDAGCDYDRYSTYHNRFASLDLNNVGGSLPECAGQSAVLANLPSGESLDSTISTVYGLFNHKLSVPETCQSAMQELVCGVNQQRRAAFRGMLFIVVAVTGQAVIFSARTTEWFFMDPPAKILMIAFGVAQFVSTFLGVYGFGEFPANRSAFVGCGWAYGLIAWVWSLLWLLPLDVIKLAVEAYFTGGWHRAFARSVFLGSMATGAPALHRKTPRKAHEAAMPEPVRRHSSYHGH